jgi:hypothetical protein
LEELLPPLRNTDALNRGWLDRRIIYIAAVWLGVRLLLIPIIIPPAELLGDAAVYVATAQDILHGNFASNVRPPGYPLFLASTLWLGLKGVFAVQSVLIMVAAIFTRYRLGFWQGLAIAGCPFFPFYEWSLLSEIWSLTLLWAGWLLTFYPRRPLDFLFGAALTGLAVLSRDILILLPLAAFVCVNWKRAAAFVAITYLPIALWLMSGPSTEARFGYNLWIGTWEHDPKWRDFPPDDQFPAYAYETPDQKPIIERALRDGQNGPLMKAAVQRYRDNPLFAFGSWVHRYHYLWIGTRTELTNLTLERGSPAWFAFKSLMFGLNGLMLGLGLATVFLRPDRRLILPVAYVALIYLPLHNTEMRYSLTVVPFLLALGVGLFANRGNPTVQKN